MMPQFYMAPGSSAGPGMTNYLTIRGKDTAFPGKEKIGLRDITDGTSKTIMAVEAADAKAVIWTKPDDFEYDPRNPMAGLVGLRSGGFNAAFCDGSVRFISSFIDLDVLKCLFVRNDGEAVYFDEVLNPGLRDHAAPAPTLPEPAAAPVNPFQQ